MCSAIGLLAIISQRYLSQEKNRKIINFEINFIWNIQGSWKQWSSSQFERKYHTSAVTSEVGMSWVISRICAMTLWKEKYRHRQNVTSYYPFSLLWLFSLIWVLSQNNFNHKISSFHLKPNFTIFINYGRGKKRVPH